ncbi:uncharacterized protein STEHIDRAFT_111606 [Stereum hirsutum FP-91666 SS1]|uniref:uncharacterized protein n=1 Tax=Stereum hirsutum (strain FP-91666) TaxID=721885 RepID=UPI000444A16C|nr:uncharacterized protein STEHIDRAFT_111606 [Stereum hirsutum FP-91666 SS1]EIM86062.1 hypothetical protein STEHIDRAFT_111606 [Stereum hirsutum FP-91666 SS1]
MRVQLTPLLTVLAVSVQISMLPGVSTKSIIEKESDGYVADASWLSLFKRDDGPSGDGECDPCQASCSINEVKRFSESDPETMELRTLHGNASHTEPWLHGEVARWEVIEGRAMTLAFNCDTIPNVCQNMCFGAAKDSGRLSLSAKRPPNARMRERKTLVDQRTRIDAARDCEVVIYSSPEKPSYKYTDYASNPSFAAGNSCDEYPFASTLEGQLAAQDAAATRCVPRGENSSQGGKISGFYRNIADGTQFTVGFSFAAGATGFCKAKPSCAIGAVSLLFNVVTPTSFSSTIGWCPNDAEIVAVGGDSAEIGTSEASRLACSACLRLPQKHTIRRLGCLVLEGMNGGVLRSSGDSHGREWLAGRKYGRKAYSDIPVSEEEFTGWHTQVISI